MTNISYWYITYIAMELKRDLKAENLLLTDNDTIKVCDLVRESIGRNSFC